MIIVTSGNKIIDMDGLACVIAYEELLKKSEKEASHYMVDSFNKTIPQIVKEFGYTPNTEIPVCDDETKFVIVDISEPDSIPDIVKPDKIYKIFDHHFGYEKYWQDKLGENSVIREIGACATLIYQEWEKSGLLPTISQLSANLLVTAIISNSLNFMASITKEEDRLAYQSLLEYASLSSNWIEIYFSTVSANIYENPINALQNDTKILEIDGKTFNIGQLEVWESSKLLKDNYQKIIEHLEDKKYKGFVTIADISKGFNSIICIDPETQELLKTRLGFEFNESLYTTDLLYLRKELIKGIISWV
jgi:inorganic pyrophosphatase/manganese-dependent inorganic pyrophosphatase